MIILSLLIARLGLCKPKERVLCQDSGLTYKYLVTYSMGVYSVSIRNQNGYYDGEFCVSAAEARAYLKMQKAFITCPY